MVLGILLFIGIKNSSPQEMIQRANEKTEESSKLIAPEGYELKKYKSQAVFDDNVFYTTTFTKGTSELTIVQKPNQKLSCDTTQKTYQTSQKTLNGVQVCYEQLSQTGKPIFRRLSWEKNNSLNSVTVADDSVTDNELGLLVASVE